MQACSMLLGQPWQYDSDCVHIGHTNQYTLLFKGKKIMLHPMTHEQIAKNELARTNSEKTHAHTPTTDHVLQQEFQLQHSHSYTTANEIKLKGPILLAIVDLDELTDHSLDGYAFLCTPVLFSSENTPPTMPPLVTNLLQSTPTFSQRMSQLVFLLFEELSTRLTLFWVPHYQTMLHIAPTQRR
jgi:hypothetical protein